MRKAHTPTTKKPATHMRSVKKTQNTYEILHPGNSVMLPAERERERKMFSSRSVRDFSCLTCKSLHLLTESYFRGIPQARSREQQWLHTQQMAAKQCCLAMARQATLWAHFFPDGELVYLVHTSPSSKMRVWDSEMPHTFMMNEKRHR